MGTPLPWPVIAVQPLAERRLERFMLTKRIPVDAPRVTGHRAREDHVEGPVRCSLHQRDVLQRSGRSDLEQAPIMLGETQRRSWRGPNGVFRAKKRHRGVRLSFSNRDDRPHPDAARIRTSTRSPIDNLTVSVSTGSIGKPSR